MPLVATMVATHIMKVLRGPLYKEIPDIAGPFKVGDERQLVEPIEKDRFSPIFNTQWGNILLGKWTKIVETK
jgi:hypothetical protein